MIPLTDASWQSQPWQTLLSTAVSDINELVSLLGIEVPRVDSDFRLFVPLPYLARIERGNADDPLLRQVLPVAAEHEVQPGFSPDALNELSQTPVPGLLHKYHGRVLVIASGACAINCRYCFRRHFPYDDFQPDSGDWNRIYEYIASDSSITEIILSGGDPLVQSDRRLEEICHRLETIEHLQTLRFHTRLPVVIPQRVTGALTSWMQRSRLKIVMVIHANHPREIDTQVVDALAKLHRAGVTLLNQSVLLKGVNDDVSSLCELSRRLLDAHVMPYYLHLLDRVLGTAHFEVPFARAQELHKAMASQLPGYLVPRLVREVPGEPSKMPVL